MRTVYTCIVGGYDDLKQPINTPPHNHQGWKFICYTDQQPSVINEFEEPVENSIWEIRPLLYIADTPAKTARWHKINFHKCVDTQDSIWLDATFFINIDLNRWWKRTKTAEFTVINHPFDDCAYVDLQSCIGGSKGDFFKLVKQATDYKESGLPLSSGLISSGILMRQKTKGVIEFCEKWWQEVEKYTERDQPCFTFVHWKNPIAHFINWDYTKDPEFIHVPHLYKTEIRKNRLRQIQKSL